jgi:hypothetical protein
MSDIQTVLADIDQLPTADKWQIVRHVLRTLEYEQVIAPAKSDWHELLRETYGILADDPIERPPQLPLEERERLE